MDTVLSDTSLGDLSLDTLNPVSLTLSSEEITSATSEVKSSESSFPSARDVEKDAVLNLKKGLLTNYIQEKFHVVSPNSEEGVLFNKEMQEFTKKYLPELITKLGCVPNFYLSDTPEPNASVFKNSMPPAIMFNRGLFTAEVEIDGEMQKILQSPGDLLFFIGHEIGHSLKTKIYGESNNSKFEEGALYSLPLSWVHDAGFSPVHAASSLTRLVQYADKHHTKVAFSQYIDPHPIPLNIDRILTATLTDLHKSRGIEVSTKTTEGAIESECSNIYKAAHSGKHISWVASKLGTDYPDLSTGEKLTRLSAICNEIDSPYPVRIRDLAKEFRKLSGALIGDTHIQEFRTLTASFFNLAEKDAPLRSGRGFTERPAYPTAYVALTGMHKDKKIKRPLGRIVKIAKRARELIAACEEGDKESVVKACKNFNRALDKEPLIKSEAGKALLTAVRMPKFKFPDEAVDAHEDLEQFKFLRRSGERPSKRVVQESKRTIRNTIVSWQALRRYAKHPEVLKTLSRVGLKNDPQILESIQQTSGLQSLKLHLKVAAPVDTLEQLFFDKDPRALVLSKGGRVTELTKNQDVLKRPPKQHLWIQAAFEECEQTIIDGYREGNKAIIKVAEEALPYLARHVEVDELRRFDIAEEFPELFLALNGLCHYDDAHSSLLELDKPEGRRAQLLNAAFVHLTTRELESPGTCTKALQLIADSIHAGNSKSRDILYARQVSEELVTNGALGWINNLPDSIESLTLKLSSLQKYAQERNWHMYEPALLAKTFSTLNIPNVFAAEDVPDLIRIHNAALKFTDTLTEVGVHRHTEDTLDMSGAISSFTLSAFKRMPHEDGKAIEPSLLFELATCLDQQVLQYELHDKLNATLLESCQILVNRDIRTLKGHLRKLKTKDALLTAGKLGSLGILSLSDEVAIQKTLLTRIQKYKTASTRISLASMLISSDVRVSPAVEIRSKAKEIIISAMQEEIGVDDGSVAFTNSLRDDAHSLLDGTTRSEHHSLLVALADAVVAQPDSCDMLEELSKQLSEEELKGAVGYGIIAEIVLSYARQSQDDLNTCLDFLLSPKESAESQRFLILMQDAISDYNGIRVDSDEAITHNLPRFLKEDPTAAQSERFLNDQAKAWHQNFWRQPLDVRAVLIRECLLGENQSTTPIDKELFDSCIAKTFNGKSVSPITKDYIFSYLQALPDFSKHLGLAALTAAGERVRGGASEEEAVATLLEYLGALQTKAGQRAASSSLVKSEKRHVFNRLKYNANKEPRWKVLKQARERKEDIERGCSDFYGEEVTIVSWGEVLGSASVSVGLEFTLSNGETHVVSLKRPYVEDQSTEGARIILDALENLELDASRKSAPIIKGLIVEAKEQLELETNTRIAKSQYDQAQEDAYGLSVQYGDKYYEIDAVQVLACGDDWYVMTKADGNHFAEEALGDEDQEESKSLAVVNLAVEFRNILRGAFDTDRHGGNLKYFKRGDTTFIKHFDLKAYQFDTINEESISELIKFFNGFVVDDFKPDEFMEQMFLSEEEEAQLHPFVRKARNALIGLAEYVKTEGFTKQDLTVSLVSALQCEDISPLVPKVIRDHFPEEMHSFVDNFFSGDFDLSLFGLTKDDLVYIKKR